MTKDEAILHGKSQLEVFDGEHREFIEMAIKALKQQPCEDCINRATVLELINDVKRVDGFKEYAQYEYLFNQVDKMPSVQPPVAPERKKGKWIKRNNDYFDWYECSECGYGSDGEMKYNRLCDVRTNYCPNCGKQMLEVEE